MIDGEIVVDEGVVCVCVFEGGRERVSERKSDGESRERESLCPGIPLSQATAAS